MKKIAIFVFLFPVCTWMFLGAAGADAAKAEKKPLPYYPVIAQKIARVMPKMHLLQFPFDDRISAIAWTNLLTSYDFDRSFFTDADVRKFESMRFRIDDAIKDGDVGFGYEVYRVFRNRVEERYQFVLKMLETKIDFSVQEEYAWDRKDAEWPADVTAQNELWRKRIKNELLAQRLAAELDAAKNTNATAKAAEASAKDEKGKAKNNEPVLTPEENIKEKYKQFLLVFQDIDEETILQRYLGAVAMAYDPHSDYMSPMRKEDFDIDMNLSFCGIGATLRSQDGAAKIEDISPGGPADRDKRPCRLEKGDKIIGVGQGSGPIESIIHWPLNRAVRKIRGAKGTKVVLKVIPASDPSGATVKYVDLIRDEIKLEEQAATGSVERVTLSNGMVRTLGYVRLPTFYGTLDKSPDSPDFRSATQDVAEYIARFNREGVSGMILDLRNNGGGSLREAIMLTGLFVSSGPAVLVREPKQVMALTMQEDGAIAFRKPLIVMINRTSASASEIVAAALQDYGRAIVVGDTKSHGKGTVQTVLPLGQDKFGSIKITTASFYRINGSSTQIRGVHSDIVIPSFLDGLDWIGEDQMPGALPWSEVASAMYFKIDNVAKFVPQLKAQSAARLCKNSQYLEYARNVRRSLEISKRKTVPLEIDARRIMMAEDRRQRKEERELTEDENELGDSSKDVILKETLNILSDLIDLRGDRDLTPFNGDEDLKSRMLRIFGI